MICSVCKITFGRRMRMKTDAVRSAQQNRRRTYWKNNKAYYYMLFPGLVLIIIFRLVPLYGLTISFKDYDVFKGFLDSPWVGLKWFRLLFESPDFLKVFRNTIVISFLDIIFVFFGSIVLAVLINEIRSSKFKRTVQTVTYLPYFLSWVVVGGLITEILSPSGAVMQAFFRIFNMESKNYLLNAKYFYGIVTAGEMWKSSGWNTILYLAAMSGISAELYEAASMDGAGKIRQIIHITLPGIKFIIITTLLMRLGSVMNVGFEKIFVLQNDMILNTAEVFSTYNYKIGIQNWNMSLSSALSFFESVTNFVLVFAFDRAAKLVGEEGIL